MRIRGNRTGAAWLVGALAAVALTGCSDSKEPGVASLDGPSAGAPPSTSGSGRPGESVEQYLARQQAYVDCARRNGAPQMRDPDEFGRIVLADLIAMEGPVAGRVKQVCGHWTKDNREPPELAERMAEIQAGKMSPKQKQVEVDFAKCMQANGVPEYPDPQPNGLPAEQPWDVYVSTVPTPPGLARAKEACIPIIGRNYGDE